MAALEGGVINPTEGLGRGSVHRRRRRAVLQRRPRRLRRGGARRSAEGLLGHLLLHGRRAGQQPRQRDPEQGPRTRDRRADRDRPAERDDRHRPQPAVAGRTEHGTKPSASASTTATPATSWPNRASRGPSATTWTWRSARAACRPIRCRWRWRTRRSPTPTCTAATARSCARTWALQIDESGGGLVQSLSFPPVRHVHLNDEDLSLVMAGHPRGRQPAGRDIRGRVGGLEPGRAPGVRQDGHRRTSSAPGTVVVHVLRQRPRSPDRDRGDRRRRRLRRRNGRADRPV